MSFPVRLRYTTDHEWLRMDDEATVGITAYAADALGDVVYIGLPAIGTSFHGGEACGEIESTKSVSELFAPATGTIVAVNDAVVEDPSLVNRDPYGDGWLFRMTVESGDDGTLDAASYAALLESAT